VSPQRRNESVPALRRSRYLMESRASPPGWTGDTPVPPPYESWVQPNISNQMQIQELVEKNTSLAFHRAKSMKDPQVSPISENLRIPRLGRTIQVLQQLERKDGPELRPMILPLVAQRAGNRIVLVIF